jgi:hypothetical protein
MPVMGHAKEVYGSLEKANALAVEALSTRLLNQTLSEEELFRASSLELLTLLLNFRSV